MQSCRAHVDDLVGDVNKTLDVSREQVRNSESGHMGAKSALQAVKLAVGEKNRELSRIENDRSATKREIATGGGTGGRASAKGRRTEAEADFNRCNDELIAYQETATAKINRVKTQIADSVDRIRELDGLITNDDNALRELSLNRAEVERMNAVDRQCALDHDTCVSEGAAVLSRYVKIGLQSSKYPGALLSAADVSDLSDVLASHIRDNKDTLASKRSAFELSKRHVYQCSAAVEAEEKRRLELRNKLSSLDEITRSLGQSLVKLNDMRRDEKFQVAGELYRELSVADSAAIIEETLRDMEEELQNRKTFTESSNAWRSRVIKKAGKSKGSNSSGAYVCPCCDRGMDSAEKAKFDTKVNELFKFNEVDNGETERQFGKFKLLQKETLDVLHRLRPFAEYKSDLLSLDAEVEARREQMEHAK